MDDAAAATRTEGAPTAAFRGGEERIELRPEDLKLLSSDSRVRILKLLDERPRTGTELGKDLGLEKSTVHGHLERLVDGGLVHRREDDRLWVYYALTPRGRRLLHPPRAGFTLLLSGSLLSAGASLTLAAAWILGNAAEQVTQRDSASQPEPQAPGGAQDSDGVASDAPPASPSPEAADGAATDVSFPVLPVLALALMLLASMLGVAAWATRPKA